MAMKVLGISASPRLKGNSDLLLRQALAGAESAGAKIEYVRLAELKISPCIECNACYKTGRCVIEDDYQMLIQKVIDADRLIFATPIFFMAVSAQAKLFIDRCQCLWANKYVLKKPPITNDRPLGGRRAMVIAVGGSKSKKMFDSIRLTMKYFLDCLDMHYQANLFVNKIDTKGVIEAHLSAANEAYRLGRDLALPATPLSEKPFDVELI
ncbi:MAG: flavodoxin family protein [Planctomycetota bacterium]|nr:flavodoxin family protein [Planctomycetota bacterium]